MARHINHFLALPFEETERPFRHMLLARRPAIAQNRR
jgi:hypothetical protein